MHPFPHRGDIHKHVDIRSSLRHTALWILFTLQNWTGIQDVQRSAQCSVLLWSRGTNRSGRTSAYPAETALMGCKLFVKRLLCTSTWFQASNKLCFTSAECLLQALRWNSVKHCFLFFSFFLFFLSQSMSHNKGLMDGPRASNPLACAAAWGPDDEVVALIEAAAGCTSGTLGVILIGTTDCDKWSPRPERDGDTAQAPAFTDCSICFPPLQDGYSINICFSRFYKVSH